MLQISRMIGVSVVLLSIPVGAGSQERLSSPSGPSPGSRRLVAPKVGYASYYGRRFHGKTTASGAVFDNDAMIAAHPVYPFGTVVRVTNLSNQQSVDVRIVDRGPTRAARKRGVIIDVSRAAAQSLGFMADGRARVRVEVVTLGPADPGAAKPAADDPER